MKRLIALFACLVLFVSVMGAAQQTGVTVHDVAKTNYQNNVTAISFPNGTVSFAGQKAVITTTAYANGSSLTDTGNGAFLLGGAASATPTNQSETAQAGVGSNIAGGNLTLASGASTGTGRSAIELDVPEPAASGSGANAVVARARAGSIALTNSAATIFATVTMPVLGIYSAQVFWTINVTDGTDVQSFSGMSTVALVCKGTTVTATITETAANSSKAVSTGTLTESITQTNAGGVVSLKMTPTSSLAPTTCRMDYFIVPMSATATAFQ